MKHLFETAALATLLYIPFKSEAQKFENIRKALVISCSSCYKFVYDINEIFFEKDRLNGI